MSTRHVLLGLLDIMPMSGYDLRRNLKISLERLKATRAMIFCELAAQASFELESAARIHAFLRGRLRATSNEQ